MIIREDFYNPDLQGSILSSYSRFFEEAFDEVLDEVHFVSFEEREEQEETYIVVSLFWDQSPLKESFLTNKNRNLRISNFPFI